MGGMGMGVGRWLVLVLATGLVVPPAALGEAIALLRTSREGVHRLDFAAAGTALGKSSLEVRADFDAGRLALHWRGQPIPVSPLADGMGLLFHAPFTRSRYFDGAVLELRAGTAPPVPEEPAAPEAGDLPVSALVQAAFETNRVAVLTVSGTPESDLWFGDNFLGSHPTFGARTNRFELPGLSPGSEGGLVITLASASETGHELAATLNGQELGGLNWSGRSRQEWSLVVPAGTLRVDGNELILASRGDRTSLVYLDRLVVTHVHDLTVREAPLVFTATAAGALTVTTEAAGPVEVWNVSDPAAPVRITGVASGGEGEPAGKTFRAEAGGRYVAFTETAVPLPARWQAITPVVWDELAGAEIVLVAPEPLLVAAESLAGYRRAQGMSAVVLPLEQLHQEFAFGEPRPAAIRDFLRAATAVWQTPPRFLVLVGDGTHDYKDHRGDGDNFLPPELVFTSFGWTAADPSLGDLDDDGVPEVAVGRLPLHSAAEMPGLLDRLAAYEGRAVPAPAAALLFAGRGDDAGNFPADSAVIGTELGGAFVPDFYHDLDLSFEAARAGLRARLATGPAYWNYIGHGGRDRLGNGYLDLADVATLDFGGGPPFFTAMTCSVGQFSVPGAESLGEALLRRAGGPLAVWSPSGFSFNVQAHLLNLSLARRLATLPRGHSVGDLLRETVADFRAAGGDGLTPLFYNLLGDPALRLPFGLAPEPPRLQATRLADGRVELIITGLPVTRYQLESTVTLETPDWRPLLAVDTDAGGRAVVSLSPGLEPGAGFHRIVFP